VLRGPPIKRGQNVVPRFLDPHFEEGELAVTGIQAKIIPKQMPWEPSKIFFMIREKGVSLKVVSNNLMTLEST
jgi:hypothetical protein